MKALVLTETGLKFHRDWPSPDIASEDDVLIAVKVAGVCRTDSYVARRKIKVKTPLIMGHEFSGVVLKTGKSVTSVQEGDHVAVMPFVACENCLTCKRGRPDICPDASFLGLSRDGAFASMICVPARVVRRLPENMSFETGAFAEPVTAALAVLQPLSDKESKGLVYGENRIAELTRRVLQTHGFDNIDVFGKRRKDEVIAKRNRYDFVVETDLSNGALEDAVEMVRPGGCIILKSRQLSPVSLVPLKAVSKGLVMHAVHYGDFSYALDLLSSGRLNLEGLLGKTDAIEKCESILCSEDKDERQKQFMTLD